MKLENNSKIREQIPFETNIPIRIFRGYDRGSSFVMPHMHEAIEIIYISEGKLDVLDSVNHLSLFPGDIHIFNSNSIHSTHFMGKVLKGIVLQISFDLIRTVVPNADFYNFSFKNENEKQKKAAIHLLESLLEQSENSEPFEYLKSYADLMYLLNILFKYCSNKMSKQKINLSQKYYNRILTINNFIDHHYTEVITLNELASKVHLNPEYLSRFISKHYGMSFYAYLTNIRLNHAYSLIKTTDIPIMIIADQTGFANYSQFNKEFKKKYCQTPKTVRE